MKSELFLQHEVRNLKKYNDKIEKEMGGTYLWDFEEAGRIILLNMKEEANMDPLRWNQFAYFIALRLKFADDKTINLIKEALYHNRKYFNESINGIDPIYVTMQYGNDYYSAIFMQYKTTQHAKESDLPLKISVPDVWRAEHIKTKFIHPIEDGKHLIYLTEDEYHEKYGLTPIEELNEEPSDEWKQEFEKFNKKYDEEIRKREIKYKKTFRKWNQKQKDELHEYMDNIRKEFNF